MKKGQIFTLDLFGGLTVFMIVLFIVLAVVAHLSLMKTSEDRYFFMESEVIKAQDYIALSDETTTGPYVMNKTAVDNLFALDYNATVDKFNFPANYSMKLIKVDGGETILESGYTDIYSEYSVSIKRFVVYDGELHELRIALWEPRVSTWQQRVSI